jgi:hypothetical protein
MTAPPLPGMQGATLELMGLMVRLRGEDAAAAAAAADAALHHALWLLQSAADGLLPPECGGAHWRAALAGVVASALAVQGDLGTAGCTGERALSVLCAALAWGKSAGGGGADEEDGPAAAQAAWLELILALLRVLPGLAPRLAPALPLLPAGGAAAAPLAACWRAAVASMCSGEAAGALAGE